MPIQRTKFLFQLGRRETRLLIRLGLALTMLLDFADAYADAGVWVPEPDFTQLNVACKRVYKCRPKSDVMYSADDKITVTPPEWVTGVCSAATGAADSCNVCLTNPPSVPCEWSAVQQGS
jgi:hypothetical protein